MTGENKNEFYVEIRWISREGNAGSIQSASIDPWYVNQG